VNQVADQARPLENLSDADKDALIARLWRDLQAERARANELELRVTLGTGDVHETAPLLKRLPQATPGRRVPQQLSISSRLRFGRYLAFLHSRSVIGVAATVCLAFVADFAIGRYQQYRLEQKRLSDLTLQHAAFEGMYVEVVSVTYEPDQKSYRLTMKFANDEPSHPLYVMQTPVRVFEQVGLSWKEVPSRDARGEAARVVKLMDSYTFETIFEPNLKDWTQLIPGYMHIRFQTDSLISERSNPDDDIIGRTDRYYVYLKPHGADDEAIRQQMKIRGDPPVFMRMPPHYRAIKLSCALLDDARFSSDHR
jgi:macrolide transport system ATP-binding/permease protein/lipoprotein-releasing system ATP-binding protein